MRANRDENHKQNQRAGAITAIILLPLVIVASITLSSCGVTTAGDSASSQSGLGANPVSLNFSTVVVGNSSSLTSTLTNNGKSNVNVSEVTVTGAGLTAAGVSGGTVLTPGQSATMTVTFAPAAAGSLANASVQIVSNAANSPLTIAVSGTGQAGNSEAVQLSWTASTTGGVLYDIFRANTSGGYGTTPLNSSPIAATTYTDTTVVSGQTYYYVATAVDSEGSSPYSNEVAVNIP